MSQAGERPQADDGPYSPADAASLVVFSFRLSRGRQLLQRSLLGWIGTEYAHRFKEGLLDEALEPAQETVYSIYTNPELHKQIGQDPSKESLRHETDGVVSGAFDMLRNPIEGREHDGWLGNLCTRVISVDGEWMPHTLPNIQTLKPWRSNLVIYGFLGRPTGRPEYDALFGTVARAVMDEPAPAWWRENDAINPSSEGGVRALTYVFSQHRQEWPDDCEALDRALADTRLEAAL